MDTRRESEPAEGVISTLDDMRGCLYRKGKESVEVGDLDQNRNLKIRTFVRLVLRVVFNDLQAQLKYREMGERGVVPGQYYQDFENYPRPYGYGSEFETVHRIALCRAIMGEVAEGDGDSQRQGRLIVETRAEFRERVALDRAQFVGFTPPLGDHVMAGRGRVLHVLTRPGAPAGQRQVREVPEELQFLEERDFEGPFPTIDLLAQVEAGFDALVVDETEAPTGIWGVPNSDIFQHVNAREYIFTVENRVTALLAEAGLPLEDHFNTRAQVIFRKPSFVGERYSLRCSLYRRGDDTLALGAFHKVGPEGIDERPSVFLRFDGMWR